MTEIQTQTPTGIDEEAGKETDTEIYKHIGARMRQARKDAGMTQTQVGEKLGVSMQQIQKYETAQNRIPIHRLMKLGQTMGRSVAWFLPDLMIEVLQVPHHTNTEEIKNGH